MKAYKWIRKLKIQPDFYLKQPSGLSIYFVKKLLFLFKLTFGFTALKDICIVRIKEIKRNVSFQN